MKCCAGPQHSVHFHLPGLPLALASSSNQARHYSSPVHASPKEIFKGLGFLRKTVLVHVECSGGRELNSRQYVLTGWWYIMMILIMIYDTIYHFHFNAKGRVKNMSAKYYVCSAVYYMHVNFYILRFITLLKSIHDWYACLFVLF